MRTLLLLFFVLSGFTFLGQQVDISMGVGYSSDVFVSMEGGETLTTNATDWHIAFDTRSSYNNAIRINDGHGVELVNYPNGDIDDWAVLDTSGLSGWPRLHNMIDSWSNGAFNVSGSGGALDFSWGYYTGDPLHDVVGDSLYVLMVPGVWTKKLRIDVLDSGQWTFTHANIDGTEETTETFHMDEYAGKNFAYYNFATGSLDDREPSNTDWDLVFTRYFGMTDFGPGATAGALANDGVQIIKATEVDVDDVSYMDYTFIADNIGLIGNDWKFLNSSFEWEVTPNQCYFVKNQDETIYKVVFNSFGGNATGDITYNAEMLSETTAGEIGDFSFLNVYPNPSNGDDVKAVVHSQSPQVLSLRVINMSGQVVSDKQVTLSTGLNQLTLQSSEWASGIYSILAISESQAVTQQLIIR